MKTQLNLSDEGSERSNSTFVDGKESRICCLKIGFDGLTIAPMEFQTNLSLFILRSKLVPLI